MKYKFHSFHSQIKTDGSLKKLAYDFRLKASRDSKVRPVTTNGIKGSPNTSKIRQNIRRYLAEKYRK